MEYPVIKTKYDVDLAHEFYRRKSILLSRITVYLPMYRYNIKKRKLCIYRFKEFKISFEAYTDLSSRKFGSVRSYLLWCSTVLKGNKNVKN